MSITSITAELRQAFPNLSDEIILKNAIACFTSNTKNGVPRTVGEVVEDVRAIFMREEHRRPRVKKQDDGSILIKDTSTYRHYETHWRRLVALHGDDLISDLSEEIIDLLADEAQQSAMDKNRELNEARVAKGFEKRELTGGTSYNSALNAFSAVMAYAARKNYIPKNFVVDMKKAKRDEGSRFGLSLPELEAVMRSAKSGGNDQELDYLLLWTLAETAARRGGLLNLRLEDLVEMDGVNFVRLFEKGSKGRLQPITRTLSSALRELAVSRGAVSPEDAVFRYPKNLEGISRPISAKRFETLWSRVRSDLPWAEDKGISSHWLRHTTLTFVERAFGPSVARSYAGHGSVTVTDRYTKGNSPEVIAAHAALTGGKVNASNPLVLDRSPKLHLVPDEDK